MDAQKILQVLRLINEPLDTIAARVGIPHNQAAEIVTTLKWESLSLTAPLLFSEGVPWTDYLDILGKTSDLNISRLFGCARKTVQNARSRYGIPPYNSPRGGDVKAVYTPPWIDWDRYDSLIGTISDAKLATKIGCSIGTVANRRHALGIPPFSPKLKQHELNVGDFDHLMGKMSDHKIAQQIGCHHSNVTARRKKIRISPYKERKSVDWSKWDHLLGTCSDNKLAEKIGCTQPAVYYRRCKLGIKPYKG